MVSDATKIEWLEHKIDVGMDSIQMSMSMENYSEFLETFGYIHFALLSEYNMADNAKYKSKVFDLIYDSLMFQCINIMKEHCME